jgi:hypothetical protein
MLIHGIRSTKHDKICQMILLALEKGYLVRSDFSAIPHIAEDMKQAKILIKGESHKWLLNFEQLQRCCYIVPDDLWERLGDPYERNCLSRKAKGLEPYPTREHYYRHSAHRRNKQNRHRMERRNKGKAERVLDLSDDPLSMKNVLFNPHTASKPVRETTETTLTDVRKEYNNGD